MNTQEFARSIDELHERLIGLTKTKGEEYKRRDDNQFANFERGARSLGLTREQVLMVYLSKHLDSIVTYIKDRAAGQEKIYAEPISGRIDDAILYLLLLRGMTVENDESYYNALLQAIEEGAGTPIDAGGGKRSVEEQEKLEENWRNHRARLAALAPPSFAPDVPAKILAGGVTTAPREVTIEVRDVYVFSTLQSAAIKYCREMGLEPGSRALAAVDQLYNTREGAVVIMLRVHTVGGDADKNRLMITEVALAREVQQRCLEMHLEYREVFVPHPTQIVAQTGDVP